MADKSGKTEQPTQQRLKKAREQGQFPMAKEFVSALQFMVFLALLGAGGAGWFAQFRQTTRSILRLAFAPELQPEDLIHVAWQLFWRNLLGGCARRAATQRGSGPPAVIPAQRRGAVSTAWSAGIAGTSRRHRRPEAPERP